MGARREPVPLDCKVYVGELGNNGTRHELEDAFGYYGPLKEVSDLSLGRLDKTAYICIDLH